MKLNVNSKHIFNNEKALKYGFKIEGDILVYEREIFEHNFLAVFRISDEKIEVKVYEEPGKEEYFPFEISSFSGSFISELREKINEISTDILDKCFDKIDIMRQILEYVAAKYGTNPRFPWDDESITLNLDNGRWFGIIMEIKKKSLGINDNGSVEIINLKLNPEKIERLIDFKMYFPAYHMNKRHWITVILDKNSDIENIKDLVDESYKLVSNK
ncbi:MAG: MmcQ/YjbR family DNA-binding protein [Tissierellia bacterium]|nr:MmcQ/YjbR family DNA-binding protein [Tissierellia bacterium]